METINKEMVEQLKELMEEDFPLLINTYLTDSDKRLQDLSLAITEKNAKEIRELAHGFKGSSSNLGADKLAEISHSLESMGDTEQLADSAVTLEALANEYEQVNAYFKSLL